MKRIFVFLVIILVTSCEYFNVKKTTPEAILNEELQTFNWNDVDAYPTFSFCDSLATKQDKRLCFENGLSNQIFNALEKEKLVVSQDINDTILLEFQISEKGVLSLVNSKIDTLILQEIPNIKSLLNQSLDTLPEIFPALKRGQQVKTTFELPIVIRVN